MIREDYAKTLTAELLFIARCATNPQPLVEQLVKEALEREANRAALRGWVLDGDHP